MTEFIKDPSAILDYQVDWTLWLLTDTITTSTWTVQAGLTAGNGSNGAPAPSNTTLTATIWLMDGVEGKRYTVTNHIVTAAGRTNERSFIILAVQL